MRFGELIGQEACKAQLLASTGQDQAGRTLILEAEAGSGRHSLARAFAQYLLCLDPQSEDSCGHCPSCRYFREGSHPDYRALTRGEDRVIKVERVRRELLADLNLRPQISERKIYLIDADDLNEQGQNALLKSLEEPPNYASLILTVEHVDSLLPTIISRAMILRPSRFSEAEMEQLLKTHGYHEVNFQFLTQYSGGIPGKALALAADEHFNELRTEVRELFPLLFEAGRAKLLSQGVTLFQSEKERVAEILDLLQSFLRDLLLVQRGQDSKLMQNPDLQGDFETLVRKIAGQQKDPLRVDLALYAIAEARSARQVNASAELLAAQLLLNLRKILTTGSSLISETSRLQ